MVVTLRRALRRGLERVARRLPPRPGLHMFCWHEIGYGHPAIDDRLVVSPEQFAEEITWIRERFRIVSCGDAAGHLDRGVPREPLAVLTFDDGFLGVSDFAAARLGDVPYTLFVNSACINGAVAWKQKAVWLLRQPALRAAHRAFLLDLKANFSMESLDALERLWRDAAGRVMPYLYLYPRTLAALPPNATLGNHTASHWILSRIPPAEVEREIANCETFLRGLGRPLSPWLAIPHGERHHMPRDCHGYRPLLGVEGPHRPGEKSWIGKRIVCSTRRPAWLATMLAGWRRR